MTELILFLEIDSSLKEKQNDHIHILNTVTLKYQIGILSCLFLSHDTSTSKYKSV